MIKNHKKSHIKEANINHISLKISTLEGNFININNKLLTDNNEIIKHTHQSFKRKRREIYLRKRAKNFDELIS